jgi:glutamate-5-semialdehyde dehydrogenase
VIVGDGQVSAEYGAGAKAWKHERMPVGAEEDVARNEGEREALRRYREGRGKE